MIDPISMRVENKFKLENKSNELTVDENKGILKNKIQDNHN